jgi:phosphatidylinositol glycan class Z
LILSSIQLPRERKQQRIWIAAWIAFNALFGVLMGIYHQGGIVPTQVFLSNRDDATNAIWWKTYSPPIWLLNGKNEVLKTHDLMGVSGEAMVREAEMLATCDDAIAGNGTYLIAPLSAKFLDQYTQRSDYTPPHSIRLEEVWRYRSHLNLDDLDFGGDGVWATLKRLIGRRGLAAWRVTKKCSSTDRRKVA